MPSQPPPDAPPRPSLLCPAPALEVDGAGTARSLDFDDVYYSASDGLAEARALFSTGAALPELWLGQSRFTVAELGVGIGLNVAALLTLWRQHRPGSGWLHVVSVEGRPMRAQEARRALGRWPELNAAAEALLGVWPPRYRGVHRRRLDDWGVTLTFFQDEVEAALHQADFQAQAWFLDSFSPARNPAMWSDQVFSEMARLSAPGARVATYTVAGSVRRGLEGAGFSVDKRPGFGKKRERLVGAFQGAARSLGSGLRTPPREGPVVVVGGGVAAASLVHALSARGRKVTCIADGGWAAGASGAPAGLLSPRLEAADTPWVRATLAAYAYSRHLFEGWPGFHPGGLFRFSPDPKRAGRLVRMSALLDEDFELLERSEAASRAGLIEAPSGLLVRGAGRIEPASLVRQLAGRISPVAARVAELEATGAGWRALDADGTTLAEAPTLIVAGGADARGLVKPFGAEVLPRGGRVAVYEPGPAGRPSCPVIWGGYLVPAGERVLVGATHERSEVTGSPEAADERLRRVVDAALPGVAARLGPMVEGWAGVRGTTKDRMPLAGPLREGLIVLSGFAGRGFAHAPLLAEMIAGDLEGAPAALERAGVSSFHPLRFVNGSCG